MQLRHGHYTTAHTILHMPLSHPDSTNGHLDLTLGAPLLILDLYLCQCESVHKIW